MQVTGDTYTRQALLQRAQCPLRAQLACATRLSPASVLQRGWRTNAAPHPRIRCHISFLVGLLLTVWLMPYPDEYM